MEYDYYQILNKLSDKTKPLLPPGYRSVNGDYWNQYIVGTSVANQKLGIEVEQPDPFP